MPGWLHIVRLSGSKSSPKQSATQSLENAEPEEAAQPVAHVHKNNEFHEFSFGAWQRRRERNSVGGYG